MTLEQLIEEKEKEFDEKFNCEPTIGNQENITAANFLRTAIEQSYLSALEAVEGEIEGMRKNEGGEWDVGVDDGMGYDEAIPHNKALSQLKEKINNMKKGI